MGVWMRGMGMRIYVLEEGMDVGEGGGRGVARS